VTPRSAVLDASVTIGLAKGGVLPLLQSLFAPLYVPPAVVQEVAGQGQGRPGATELQAALGRWITEVTPDPNGVGQLAALTSLSVGDREVLALALEKNVSFVLSSDRVLCREAAQRGLACLTAAAVTVLLKDRSLISEVRPVLDRMRAEAFGISEAVYQAALQAAGE
jgi:uncharacterized protein